MPMETMQTIDIPVDVVRMGSTATWLYAYLALLDIDGKKAPPEREHAMTLGLSYQSFRTLKNKVTNARLTQEQRKTNATLTQTYAENEAITIPHQRSTNARLTQEQRKTNANGEEKEVPPNIYNITPIEKEENIEKHKNQRFFVKSETKSENAASVEATNEKLEIRCRRFYDSLVPYVGRYGKDMVREFYDYWSEPNRSKTKMRMELERTWSVGLRLATWERRSNGTNKTSGQFASCEHSGSGATDAEAAEAIARFLSGDMQ